MNGQKQKIAVCVSGGGTNLQAIIDKINDGTIKNTEISVVISNKPDAYALERAKKAGIDAVCIRPKDYENRDDFANTMVDTLKKHDIDLVVLAGYLVIVPVKMIHEYRNRIINIHQIQIKFLTIIVKTTKIIRQLMFLMYLGILTIRQQ